MLYVSMSLCVSTADSKLLSFNRSEQLRTQKNMEDIILPLPNSNGPRGWGNMVVSGKT